jgi:hypothetical protein
MSKTFKYLDKSTLEKINHISETIYHYNRTLPQRVIDMLDPERFILISFNMLHEHIAGKIAEPHMRCVMYPAGQPALSPLILDMPLPLYDALPTHTVEEAEETTQATATSGV